MKTFMLYGSLCLALLLSACKNGQEDQSASSTTNAPGQSSSEEVAVISTTRGDMVIAFWPDVAPKTVENFKTLAGKDFYNGTTFHRVIKGFMIQGGDPLTKDPGAEERYGQGGPGYSIQAEFNDRPHERGVISMARSSDPNSAGSQFFICDAPAEAPSMRSLNGKYTAFGKLIRGEDVLERIANTPVTPSPMGEPSKPTERIEIVSVKIVPADSIK